MCLVKIILGSLNGITRKCFSHLPTCVWGKQRKSVVRKVADRKKDPQHGDTGIAKSCPTLCDPMKCNWPGSSVHGSAQARILEWVSISFSRGSYGHRNRTHFASCMAGGFFATDHQGSHDLGIESAKMI